MAAGLKSVISRRAPIVPFGRYLRPLRDTAADPAPTHIVTPSLG
jgi:hypothetical protein